MSVTNATSSGRLTVYPGAGVAPGTTTVDFPAGKLRSNNAVIGLSGGLLSVYDGQLTGAVDAILDVSGYFR